MTRLFACLGLAFVACLVVAPRAFADEEPAKKKEVPAVYASDEDAAEALKTFKVEFKAKGLKGDDKTAARVWAIKRLAQTQHKQVADRLVKLMRDRNIDVKTAAVQYMGFQRSLVGYAGPKILTAMAKNTNDSVFLISALQAIQDLGYQGGTEMLREMIKHKDYAVQKSAMFAIGKLKDMRLLEEVFQLLRKIKAAKGDSWDGASVTYDTGTAGDGDQKMAEKLGKEQLAKNKGKARGRAGPRSQRDMSSVVEEVLKKLTGEEFESSEDAKDWMEEHAEGITEEQKALNDLVDEQHESAKDL